MPLLFRGAGAGSYWAAQDARISGFTTRTPGAFHNANMIIRHIRSAPEMTNYISLSRSFGIARDYALYSGIGDLVATQSNPGYVYVLEINEPLPVGFAVIDPVQEIAMQLASPLAQNSYQHDGDSDFLLGVIRPRQFTHYLQKLAYDVNGQTYRSANLSNELETFVRALRDAELLAIGTIPARYVVDRVEVWR